MKKKEYLTLLQWLSDRIVFAIQGKLVNVACNALGNLLRHLLLERSRIRGSAALVFPSIHVIQVRGCACHRAYYTLEAFVRSSNAPVVAAVLPLSLAAIAALWTEYRNRKQRGGASMQAKSRKTRILQTRRASTGNAEHHPCRRCGKQARSFSACGSTCMSSRR